MNVVLNGFFRTLIKYSLIGTGLFLHILFLLRIRFYFLTQQRLRKKYKINSDTPILNFGDDLQQHVLARHKNKIVSLARTSGSTASAKQLPYTKQRIRLTAFQFIDVFARAFFFLRPSRTVLFIFSSPEKDQSLTSFLLEDSKPASWIATLQAPYRALNTKVFSDLILKYDLDNVRLFLIILSNPGVLYATNPSTLVIFFDEIKKNWLRITQLARDYSTSENTFPEELHRHVRLIASEGYKERLQSIVKSQTSLPVYSIIPGLQIYSCWTGGYVAPFLKRLEQHLPPDRYQLLPMYSMSTETIETITDCSSTPTAFLPMGMNVFYEYIENERSDHPQNIQTQLEVGKSYKMIVSDNYGLKRYQTNDLFLCERIHRNLPSLQFLRRVGLEYSFTGEKITAEQLQQLYQSLNLSNQTFTCIPSMPLNAQPHYKLLLIDGDPMSLDQLSTLAQRAEQELCRINEEYRSKVASLRINKMSCQQISLTELFKRTTASSSEFIPSQFKVLPLYKTLWETYDVR